MVIETMFWFYAAGAAAGAGVASNMTRNFDDDSRKIFLVAGGIAGFAITQAIFGIIVMVAVIWIGFTVFRQFRPEIEELMGHYFDGKSNDRTRENMDDKIEQLKKMGMDADDIIEYLEER